MSTTTPTPTIPGTTTAPGVGAVADNPLLGLLTDQLGAEVIATTERPPSADPYSAKVTATRRAGTPDYHRWLAHVSSVGGCQRPIRLAGHLHTINPGTGEILSSRSTETLPDGVVYVPCGDRRATVCPACAETYRADTYQLIRAGLVGGKGVPDTVTQHPVVFATFTAPAFGPVHSRVVDRKTGKVKPCRMRRTVSAAATAGCWPAPNATPKMPSAWGSRCARSATTTTTTPCGTPGPPNSGGAPPSPPTASSRPRPRARGEAAALLRKGRRIPGPRSHPLPRVDPPRPDRPD